MATNTARAMSTMALSPWLQYWAEPASTTDDSKAAFRSYPAASSSPNRAAAPTAASSAEGRRAAKAFLPRISMESASIQK